MIRAVFCSAMVLLAVQGVFADATVRTRLDTCISYYQDGDYQKAVDSLKTLLPLIADQREEAEAYKYLGFSYVMLEMIDKAKEFFRVALDKFPQMVIDTLEVPPNIAIVFKQTKVESQMDKGEILDKKGQEQNQKRTVIATIFTATGTVGAGIGGYFLYRAYQSHNDYLKPFDTTKESIYKYQDEISRSWNQMLQQLVIGGCASGIAIVCLSYGTYLFLEKPANPKKVGLLFDGNGIYLSWRF